VTGGKFAQDGAWAGAGLFVSVLLADQITKFFALRHLGDGVFLGQIHSDHARKIAGDFLWFFVAYNPGAAFSMSPQTILPFLPPTVFYALLTAVAGGFLVRLWFRDRSIPVRTGATMVLAGALGNLLDRFRLAHVVDFISVGVPGIAWRWPTFNVADSAISVGVCLLLWGEANRSSRPEAFAPSLPATDPEETQQAAP
jgi:signal peptidase II